MKKVLFIGGLLAILMVWILIFDKTEECIGDYFTIFILAPFGEELFYRYIPLCIGKRINFIDGSGLIANFFFINIHVNNYSVHGWYYAFAIQGVMGWFCFVTCRKYGYFSAVILHSLYNISLAVLY